jgi:Predicted Zn-dependent hydrolases of the beta-lactamase fold
MDKAWGKSYALRREMEISWLGHSCFLIKGKEETIITDPYHPDLGYSLGEPQADIVTVSHFHPGHSYIEGIAGNPRQIKGPGEYEIGGIFITGIAAFHDNEQGKARGKNTIYLIEMDGMTLCHLGDLGHPLTSQSIEELGMVDILFLPVGEISTIPISVAVEIVKQLNPHIVIPMHYKTAALTTSETLDSPENPLAANLKPVDEFLGKMGIQQTEAKAKLSITQSSLPASTQIVTLNYV